MLQTSIMTPTQRLVLERIQNSEAIVRLKSALDLALEAHLAMIESSILPMDEEKLKPAMANHSYFWRIWNARFEEVRAVYAIMASFERREEAIEILQTYEKKGLILDLI